MNVRMPMSDKNDCVRNGCRHHNVKRQAVNDREDCGREEIPPTPSAEGKNAYASADCKQREAGKSPAVPSD